MTNKKQRMQNRQTARILSNFVQPLKPCLRCGVLTKSGHYAPPSFGEEGYWLCEELKMLVEKLDD